MHVMYAALVEISGFVGGLLWSATLSQESATHFVGSGCVTRLREVPATLGFRLKSKVA